MSGEVTVDVTGTVNGEGELTLKGLTRAAGPGDDDVEKLTGFTARSAPGAGLVGSLAYAQHRPLAFDFSGDLVKTGEITRARSD